MSSTTIDKCAACGKEGDGLKACTACFMVKYCNRDCQVSHRKQHKKECKQCAAEIYDEKLFKDHPPQDDCTICMLPMPINANQSLFKSCCGKIICCGCIFAMMESEGKDLCAFCRTPPPSSDEESIKRLKKLMDKGNGDAFAMFAGYYTNGRRGLAQDHQMSKELLIKAGELGCATGYYNLGCVYDEGHGVEMNTKKAKYYWELAAMNGSVSARHNLGCIEGRVGNHYRGLKHMFIAARAGDKNSLDTIKRGFQKGIVTKEEYADTLRAYLKIQDEMKSDMRDKAVSEMQD